MRVREGLRRRGIGRSRRGRGGGTQNCSVGCSSCGSRAGCARFDRRARRGQRDKGNSAYGEAHASRGCHRVPLYIAQWTVSTQRQLTVLAVVVTAIDLVIIMGTGRVCRCDRGCTPCQDVCHWQCLMIVGALAPGAQSRDVDCSATAASAANTRTCAVSLGSSPVP